PAPLALLAALRAVATPDAQQLAACLSVVKPLTMPVMRLIQGAMLPGSEASALAQVLISGLLVQTPSALPTPEDQAVHEIDDAVRAQLAGTLRRSEWLRVNLAVQRFIEAETGLGFDFMAYLEDALGDHEVAPAALPFARFARTLADRFRAPGAPQAGARARQLEEAVVGRGLTVRAHRLVSTTIQRLKWSPDGRLMVLHAVGVDILASRTLAAGPRVREGPHVVEWLVHGDDRATLEPWFAQLESQAERQSGEPFSFRMTTYERKPSNEVVEARDRLERASASVTRLIAVTRRSAASGQQALPAWLRSLTSLRGPVVSTGWSPVPLDGDRVEPALPDWLRGWVGLLEQRPDSPATAAAISALIGHVHADERTEDPGRILDAAWGPGSERAELASLRRAAGESVIIDVVQGDPASAPRWLGAPSGPRQEPVDFDVHPVSGNFAVAYPNGEVWAWRPGADRQSLQVPREKAAAIRWSADGGVLGCATPDGFFGDMVSFSPSSPARK
ncbi:MAG: hypothetical protein ABJD97_12575, partial [Betaproteobacteria bacterium]